MIKINIQQWLSVIVAAFIGTGVGVCVALWFKLPDHTVDVFAFVESAVVSGLQWLRSLLPWASYDCGQTLRTCS